MSQLLSDRQEKEIRQTILLVEKGLDQLRSCRDIRFGRGQKGACRQGTQLKIILKSQKVAVVRGVTEIVGHWDETEAGDVSVIPGLVELFLSRVITGESLGGFLTVKITIVDICRLTKTPSGLRLLTNLRRLEGAFLQLLLQLCQRGVGDHLLEKEEAHVKRWNWHPSVSCNPQNHLPWKVAWKPSTLCPEVWTQRLNFFFKNNKKPTIH